MDIALPANVCVYCNNWKHFVIVCDKCLGVAYCSNSCLSKDLKKHKKFCLKIEKYRNNVEEVPGHANELKRGFHSLDMTLDYKAEDVQFNLWLMFVYSDSATFLTRLYNQIFEKRKNYQAVEQLLKWKLEEMKAQIFQGFLIQDAEDYKSMADLGCSHLVMNCLTALGRYQEALDFAAHWSKDSVELLEVGKTDLLVKHLKTWVDGEYEKQDITKPFDLRLIDSRDLVDEGDIEAILSVGFSLVIIKLYVRAVMENHLSKRDRFLTFMHGTHPRLGSHSNVMRIAGMTPAVRLIAKYCDISTNPLGIPSNKISTSSVCSNELDLTSLLEQINDFNSHALFAMTGDYSLRKLDFQSEEEFLSKPEVKTSWNAGTWSRVILEKLEDKERVMLVGLAKDTLQSKFKEAE
eukprot:GFUD01015674.1.p1 GENE.GFUD01015674.1~~GFUD01015674.1.p1  ORF type:complete len:406 (+),score=85.45 GFUD01015674.1:65-1282(+)